MRVLKRHPGAKLVKHTGEQDSYSVSDGDTILCASAKSPTDAWRRAALAIDYPYSDAGPAPLMTNAVTPSRGGSALLNCSTTSFE